MTALKAPYGLIFEGLEDPVTSVGRTIEGWDGDWPPPEVIVVATGRITGLRSYVAPEEFEPGALEELTNNTTIELRRFTRRSYSSFTKETAGEHVWPCAQYVEEGHEYLGDGRVS